MYYFCIDTNFQYLSQGNLLLLAIHIMCTPVHVEIQHNSFFFNWKAIVKEILWKCFVTKAQELIIGLVI